MGLILKNEPLSRTDIAFQSPTQVKFGVGKVANLGSELQIEDDLADLTRVVLITDAALNKLGVADRVRAGLEGTSYEVLTVFDAVPSEAGQHDTDGPISIPGKFPSRCRYLAGKCHRRGQSA